MKKIIFVLMFSLLVFGCVPKHMDGYVSGVVDINGTVYPENFDHYTLEYGYGEIPEQYTTDKIVLINDGLSATTNSKLGVWNTSGLDEGLYHLRLKVYNQNNNVSYDDFYLFLDNVVLLSPEDNSLIDLSEPLKITGTVFNDNLDHYTITYSKNNLPFTNEFVILENNGQAQVDNGLLGTIDVSSFSLNDELNINLKVYLTNGEEKDESVFVVIQTEDDYETNEDFDSAKLIDANSVYNLSFFPEGDNDYFKFNAEQGKKYVVKTQNLEGVDTVLSLYNSTRDFVLLNDDVDDYGDLSSKIVFVPGYTGEYYLWIRDYSDSFQGSYQLNISSVELTQDLYEPNNNIDQASLINFNNLINAIITNNDDIDYYKINGNIGENFLAILNDGEDSQYLNLDLVDSDGQMIESSYVNELQSLLPIKSISNINYLKVNSNLNSIGGNYSVIVKKENYGSDDTSDNATNFIIGTSQEHLFEKLNDLDWVKFSAEEGKVYNISTSNLSYGVDTVLKLYSPNLQLLNQNDDSIYNSDLSSFIQLTALESGVYYLEVIDYSGNGLGVYNLSIISDSVFEPSENMPYIISYSPANNNLSIPVNNDIEFSVFVNDSRFENNIIDEQFVVQGSDDSNRFIIHNSTNINQHFENEGLYSVHYSRAYFSDSFDSDLFIIGMDWFVNVTSGLIANTFDGVTTDLNSLTDEQLENTSVVLERTNYGVIEFMNNLNMTNMLDLDNNVIINQNMVSLNSNVLVNMNHSANILVKNVGVNPVGILYSTNFNDNDENNYDVCSSRCSNVIHNGMDLNFDVDGFSSYLIKSKSEIYNLSVPNSVEISGAKNSISSAYFVLTNEGFKLSNLNINSNADVEFSLDNSYWSSSQSFDIDKKSTQIIYVRTSINDDVGVRTDIGDITISNNEVNKVISDFTTYSNSALEITDVSIKVDGKKKNIDQDDSITVKPGSDLEVRVDILNNLDDLDIQNIDMDLIVYNIDDGDDVDESIDSFKIRANHDLTKTLTFTLPKLVNDEIYDAKIKISGEDENHVNQEVIFTFVVEVDKERHDVQFVKTELFNDQVSCNVKNWVDFKILNIGLDDESEIKIKIENSKLNLNYVENLGNSYGTLDVNDQYSSSVPFEISNEVLPGNYNIMLSLYLDDSLINSIVLPVNVEKCLERHALIVNPKNEVIDNDEKLNSTMVVYTSDIMPVVEENKSEGLSFYSTLLICGVIFLLGFLIYLVSLLFMK